MKPVTFSAYVVLILMIAATREAMAADKTPSLKIFNHVRILPAKNQKPHVVGGKLSGSNVSQHEGYVTLSEIDDARDHSGWFDWQFANDKPYRWIRYEAPTDSHGDIAEIEFYAGDTKLGGRFFGAETPLPTNNWKSAVDNKPDSSFVRTSQGPAYVGLDVGESASTARPSFSPGDGDLASPQHVAMKCATPGATIRYTLDGTTPGPNDGMLYHNPIQVDTLTTLVAVAFSPNLAPSPEKYVTYLVGAPVSKRSSFSIGNSLTGNAGKFPSFFRTAGRVQSFESFLIGGSLTSQLWKAKETFDRSRWDEAWSKATLPLDFFTVQPRDFNVDQEVEFELKFFDQIRATSPDVQPWIYAEWVESKRERPSDKGEVPTWQMTRTVLALTWEESMSAMMLYVEEVQHRVMKTYQGRKRPRIIPVSLAMGRVRNMIDRGEMPGVAPGEQSFYDTLFADHVHVSTNGCYLVDLVWYAALYGESPEGKVLPVGTTFNAAQARTLQRLAWDVVQNYPDCGVYEDGETPVARPRVTARLVPTTGSLRLSIASATPGAWFRYTLDGSTPSRTRGYISCGDVSIQRGTKTFKVVGYRSGMADSEVLTIEYLK